MKFLPYEKFTIETNIPASKIHKRLKEEVRPRGYVMPKEKRAVGWGKLFYRDLRLFNGIVDKGGFCIRQRFPTFSRGVPSITGNFEAGENDMNIHVIVGSKWIAVFFLILFIGAIFGSCLMTYQHFQEKPKMMWWSLKVFRGVLTIPLLVWLSFFFPFWWELRKIKTILYRIFQS